jgi:S-adenosylmethionine:tRNA ribosyltransferase-isomerase
MTLSRSSGAVGHAAFRDLPDLLRSGDLLVVNRSRVIAARLRGRRASGGAVEMLLLRPHAEDRWEALLRPRRTLRVGEVLTIGEELSAQLEEKAAGTDGVCVLRFMASDGDTTAALQRHGHVPLPPYIRRADSALDRERYQTIFAREPGSVAAPTAGLHFSPELVERLARAGIGREEIVLHVGPATFQPVRVEDVRDHRLPPEPYSIPADTVRAIAQTRARSGRVIAVGTTTTRALEASAAAPGGLRSGEGQTDLVITPGFQFRVVDALLTNFHLPRSSLLLLVSAYAGRERVLAAYAQAIQQGYRFYSYGDAMLIE